MQMEEKVESCSRIKDVNESLKCEGEYYGNLYNIYTQEQVAVHMCL